MKPAPFAYIRTETVEQAVEVLARDAGDACILAGGQSLIALMNQGLARPRLLLDISRISALARCESDAGFLTVGAAVTQSEVERINAAAAGADAHATHVPLLALALPHVGHVQTRNKGTLCGAIAHADPSGELPLCLATLGGDVHLLSARGQRVVAADTFFIGFLRTACEPDELVECARFPVSKPGDGHAFAEMTPRHDDVALVAVAVKATDAGIRIGIGGACDKPHVREWPLLEGSAMDDALNALAWDLEFASDRQASARARRDLVRTLGRRAILDALGRRSYD